MHKRHGAEAGSRRCAGALLSKRGLESAHEDAEYRSHGVAFVSKQVTHVFGDRKHPLARGDPGEHVVCEVGGRLDHAPRVARGTDAPRPARERHEEIVPASVAPRPSNAVRGHPAFEVLAKYDLDITWDRVDPCSALARQSEKGLQVFPDEAVEKRSFRPTGTIKRRCLGASCGCQG